MTEVTIEQLTVPRSLDDASAADFIAATEVRNTVEALGYGTEEFRSTAAEELPSWHRAHEPRRLLVARLGSAGRIVGRGFSETRAEDSWDVAWVAVQVLPEFRRRGIGTALTDRIEHEAAAEGRSRMLVYTVSPDGPGRRLAAPTGFGSVPRDNDEVRFLLGRGYRLEQVERGSRLALPLDRDELDRRWDAAVAASGSGYAVRRWVGGTPERWRKDQAHLLTRMSTDAPTAGLDEPEDVWTVDRLLEQEALEDAGPLSSLTSAVEHVQSGTLVGFTSLSVSSDPSRAVEQDDTLVLREHRGHRLGMLLKVANLRFLQEVAPGHPSVLTFNAEENRHMLSVNEELGFVPIGFEGAWRKDL